MKRAISVSPLPPEAWINGRYPYEVPMKEARARPLGSKILSPNPSWHTNSFQGPQSSSRLLCLRHSRAANLLGGLLGFG